MQGERTVRKQLELVRPVEMCPSVTRERRRSLWASDMSSSHSCGDRTAGCGA